MDRSRLLVTAATAAVVAAAAALLGTLPQAHTTDGRESSSALEPVSRTDLACPPGRDDAVLKVAAAAGLPEPVGGAEHVELGVERPDAKRTLKLERGALEGVEVGGDPAIVRGAGGSAPGLLAARGEREGSTLAAAPCLAPRAAWWFGGAGAGVDNSSVLYLTNADEGPAVVDVKVHGATGKVDEAGTRGLTLAPGETLRLPLVEVAPGSDELAVEVEAGRGRVVAHLLNTVRTGEGHGREWVPASSPPATDVVLAGVPEDTRRSVLVVQNPGEDQALVRLQIVTEKGAFVPLGSEELSVDPGTVEKVDLTGPLKGRAAALRLTSEVAVIGAVRSVTDGDVSYAVAPAVLEQPSGAVLVGERSEVQVVGGTEAEVVQLLVLRADGRRVLERGVTAPASGLVRVRLPEAGAYAVVLPRSGDGFAAVVHTGPGTAGEPFTTLPATVRRPVVRVYTGQSDS